jgi:hypothetical protein
LTALAAGRIAAVDSVLRAKGIDGARISHGEAVGEPVEGKPVVKIRFKPLSAAIQARPESPKPTEEGQ